MEKGKDKKQLTHITSEGKPGMVDVGSKPITQRMARAKAVIRLGKEIMTALTDGEIHSAKGPVFQTAIVAGTMAAKKTGELIPFCHPLGLDDCKIAIYPVNDAEVAITCTVSLFGKTGVEMEALTGANIAALTIYDMCKALSLDIEIVSIQLMEKRGGKRDFKRD